MVQIPSGFSGTRFKRIVPNDFSGRRFPRQIPRVKRTQENVGYYVPTRPTIDLMITWVQNLSRIYLRKIPQVDSYLNNYEDFYSKGLYGLSTVIDKYRGFHSETEFLKLSKAGVAHRMMDHLRDIFRKKRFGFTVSFIEESDGDDISTIASVNKHSTIPMSSYKNLADFSWAENMEYQSLLKFFRKHLTQEALQVFEQLVEDRDFSSVDRTENSSAFEEIQSLTRTLLIKEPEFSSLIQKILQPNH